MARRDTRDRVVICWRDLANGREFREIGDLSASQALAPGDHIVEGMVWGKLGRVL